jgi:ABC-2 type transport system permease protein
MSTPTPTSGVIHDIGYRHYDGERRGRSYIRRSLYVDSLKGAYGVGRSARYKVMPMILLAVMCLPAGAIVAITAVTNSSELVGGYTSYLLNLQLVVLIFVAAQAPATVSRDLRYSVMSLYFSRPLERVDYVVAKSVAMMSALFVLTAMPLTIMFAGALVVGLPIGEQIPDYLRAVAGAALLSLVLGGISLVIAAITPRRGLAVAAIIAVLLVLVGVQAVLGEIAFEEGLDSAAYFGLLSPFTLVQGVQSALLGGASPVLEPPGVTGALVFSGAALLVILSSFTLLLWRYRSVSAT